MSEQQKDLRKLCILNAKETETDDDIRNVCEEFGQLIGFNRPPNNKRLAFPLFNSLSDAAAAKEGLIAKGYHVDFANAKPATGNGSGGGFGSRKRDELRSAQNLNGSAMGGSENGDSVANEHHENNSSTENRPFGKCIRCHDKAYYNCGRCGDFYCSEECQASDWLEHKRNCFPMPKLMPAKSHQNIMLGKSMEKLKLSDSTDAADGHSKVEAEPLSPRVSSAHAHSPKKIEFAEEKQKEPKRESNVGKPVSVHSIDHVVTAAAKESTKNTKESSDNSLHDSLSSRQKIAVLSQSAQSSTTAIHRTISKSIPNGAEVMISHVRNYHTVYVRAVAGNEAFTALLDDVSAAAVSAPSLKSYPYPKEDTVLAPFEGAYYRGLVLACNEDAGSVRVGYIDFGNSKEVPFSTLKVLPNELKERPRLTFMVKLKNLKVDPEPNEENDMKEHLDKISDLCSVLKVVGDRDCIEGNDVVELFDVISNRSVNDELNTMVQKRYDLSNLKQKVLKVDPGNLPVLMALDTLRLADNIITCLVKDDIQVFMTGDEKTQEYGEAVKMAPAYKPKKKELCVVRIKDAEGQYWYRCLYQAELVDERAQVYCIDYGKIDTIRVNNIRAMSSKLEHEITSFVCLIKNGKDVSSEKRAKHFMEHPEFTPSSIEFDQETHQHVLTVDFSNVA